MELTVTEIAKEHPISAREINEILEREGIQYRDNGIWRLHTIYRVLDIAVPYSGGLRWTERGRRFIRAILEEENKVYR